MADNNNRQLVKIAVVGSTGVVWSCDGDSSNNHATTTTSISDTWSGVPNRYASRQRFKGTVLPSLVAQKMVQIDTETIASRVNIL